MVEGNYFRDVYCLGNNSANSYISPPLTENVTNNKKLEESVAKEDMAKLIDIMETCTPLWNHKISLSERSEAIKSNMWNRVFVEFNGNDYFEHSVILTEDASGQMNSLCLHPKKLKLNVT